MSPPRALLCLAALVATASCAGTTGSDAGTPVPGEAAVGTVVGDPCPVEPIPVVVSVDQWRDLVQSLAGRCATVTALVTGATGDPHDHEPTAADVAALGRARIVVVNGLGYDTWASSAVAARTPAPELVTAAEAAGAREGDNPHLWYDPEAIDRTQQAVSDALRRALPDATNYLVARSVAWRSDLAPYTGQWTELRARHAGRRVASTEPVFAPMVRALGLEDVTPPGYAAAAANGSDPSPADLAALRSALRNRQVDVLVVNTQTEGSVPERLREVAEDAGVPVVEVTETVAPGQPSFVAWQVDQLRRLDAALSEAGS